MKLTLIIIGILVFAFIGFQVFALLNRNKIETYPFELVKNYKDFEIRKYAPSLFTSVTLPTNEYREASGRGFSTLAGYIFGGNERNEKIAMTSPVAMNMDDSITMMFMVPGKFKKEDLPSPNQTNIEFHEEPSKVVAAIRFGGWANSRKINKNADKLRKYLEQEGIPYKKGHQYLGYNPPYDLIRRRNEVIIELENYTGIHDPA